MFLPLASDTLCYSRMISDWPPPTVSVHSRTTSLFALLLRVSSLLSHHSFPLFVILFYKYFYCYSSTVFFVKIFRFILAYLYILSFLILTYYLLTYIFPTSFSYSFKFIIFYFYLFCPLKEISLSVSARACVCMCVPYSILFRFSYSRGAVWE